MRRFSAALLLFAAAAVAACTTTTDDGGGGGNPSSRQLNELSASLQDEIESQVPTFTLGAVPGAPPGVGLPVGCPTLSNTNDSDGDDILDDATVTFTNPPCQTGGFHGGTLALTGSVRVQDPSANSTSFNLTLTDMTWQFTAPSGGVSYTEVRNGTRVRTGSSNALAVVSNLTLERQRLDITAVATIDLALNWAFTAASPGSIAVGQDVPDGSLTLDGTWHWVRSSENWNLAVTTEVPLVYDADCTATAQRIKGGRVLLTGTVAGVPGTLRVQWSACDAAPSRTWIPAP